MESQFAASPTGAIPSSRVSLSDSRPFRKIVTGSVLFFLICFVAVAGYVSAGWKLDDSIYMVVITIFGVGYGEVRPIESPGLRALTIIVIVSGYAAVIYTIGGIMQMLIDGELNSALGARRMSKGIERLNSHTIVCGFGRMGTILARELVAANKPFVLIDCDRERLKVAQDLGYLVIHGDATEETILNRAGISKASTVAAVLSDDAINVFVTITARGMNPAAQIIARGENPQTEKKLLGCGANRVVLPTAIGASKVAQLIVRPTAEDMLEQLTSDNGVKGELGHIGLQFHDLTVTEDSPLVDKQLANLEVKSNHGFLVIAVRRADGNLLMNPGSETILSAGDEVVVLGHDNDIPRLFERFTSKKAMMYRGQALEV